MAEYSELVAILDTDVYLQPHFPHSFRSYDG